MEKNLELLADELGIARYFSDAGIKKCNYEVSEKIVRFFCRQFGFKADTPQEAEVSLQKLWDRSWKKAVENIIILRPSAREFPIYLKRGQAQYITRIAVRPKSSEKETELPFELKFGGQERQIGNAVYQQWQVCLETELDYGYYDLEIVCGTDVYNSVLAYVPEKCYTDEAIESAKLWGFSVQLYALKSERNWGVGDFTDLKKFVRMCADVGADVIGLNPLNVLFHDFPENASPYSSISRLFLNPIYIDVAQVPGFKKNSIKSLAQKIDEAKSGDLIDYTKVYNLKIEVLHELFEKVDKNSKYYKSFMAFKAEKGVDLEMLATYQSLYHTQCHEVWGGWQAWDKNLQNPQSLQVAQFKQAHEDEIEFFKFLQFEADRQLKSVYDTVKECGLKIGLYRDLPVGVCKDSAELWADRYVFVDKAGAGAPPDAFFPCGQKWCLGAFNPYELKNRAYEPFLKILRANMAYAGALRIDHVMGLMRLFMIPDSSEEGTYIYYNFQDMLGLVALESYLHKCAIVGESIGNVPEGFLENLKAHNIYSISVLWAERWNGCGDFKMPRDYPQNAFVSIGTHDMAPLKMWWFGYEIELMHRLKMINDEERMNAYRRRECDRKMLLAAMDFNGTWPTDNYRHGDYLYGEGYPEGLEEAAHKLVAESPSKVVMLQLEDIFQADVLQNLPGTDRDKYPNWRHKLSVNLEDMENMQAWQRNTAILKKVR